MRRLSALIAAAVFAAALLAGTGALAVGAAEGDFARIRFACTPNGTLPGSPTTYIASVMLSPSAPALSSLSCWWGYAPMPFSAGGPCRYEDDRYIAEFRKRVLVPGFVVGTTLSCSDAVITAKTDLRITKTDGQTSAVPGTPITYTITVTNLGPSAAPGTAVADTFPATLTNPTWTAVGAGGASGFTANGSGNIADTVDLPPGASVTYTVAARIDPATAGSLANTATVTAGPGVVDTNAANNSATDIDTLVAPQADLGLTVVDNVSEVLVDDSVTYTITVTNYGPNAATNIFFQYSLVRPDGNSGSAVLAVTDLAPGASSLFTALFIAGSQPGQLTLTGTVTSDIPDPDPTNHVASDTNTVVAPLVCAPPTQTVQLGQSAQVSATGGTGTYGWSAPGGTPAAASGPLASFSTTYASSGTKTITLISGTQTAQCQVFVPTPPG
jgi:uncharacterized repeat protein (TIGR01451 family)